MTYQPFVAFGFFSLLLAGCGTLPHTPDILIQNAKDKSMHTQKETFEVKRPVSQIADVFRKKASECLNVTVTQYWIENGRKRSLDRVFTPHVLVDKQRVRLTLQAKFVGTTELGSPPPDGWYIMVADAYPVAINTTRVESYFQWTSEHAAFKAVKHWATESNMGCPDLTK